MKDSREPCETCKANNNPNCGNDWCHTRNKDNEKVWIVDCNLCGAKNEATWKQAVNERSACCGSYSSQIYHRKNLQKEKSEE